jgi:hypothetical protein
MDIDYNAIVYAGADLLDFIADDAKRKEADAVLHKAAPFIESALRKQIADLVDEINGAVGEHYAVRLVHADTADFVEVRPSMPKGDD